MAFPAILVQEDLHWTDWGDLLKGISQASTHREQELESSPNQTALCAATGMCQKEGIKQSTFASNVTNRCISTSASNATTP